MQKSIRKSILPIVLLTMLFVMIPLFAHATISQSGIYKDKAVLNFTREDSYTVVGDYKVMLAVNSGEYKQVMTVPSTATSATVTGLSSVNTYRVRIEYTYETSYGCTYTNYIYMDNYDDIALIPQKVTGVKQSRWYHYIKIVDGMWNGQKSVSGYQYEMYNAKGKLVKKGTNSYYSSTTMSLDNVNNKTTYRMRVRAYTEWNGKTYWGDWSDYGYFVGQTPNVKIKFKNKKMTVSWSKIAGATGYSVMVSTKSNGGFKKLKTVSSKKNKVTIKKFGKKKFKKGKVYYIYIMTNKKVGKVTFTSSPKNSPLYVDSAKCK